MISLMASFPVIRVAGLVTLFTGSRISFYAHQSWFSSHDLDASHERSSMILGRPVTPTAPLVGHLAHLGSLLSVRMTSKNEN